MNIVLQRFAFTDRSTIGRIYVDDDFVCYSLEDVVRDVKIYGETAIPEGTYQIAITFSPHFQRNLPLLVDVPNYQGVRIHPGNTDADTDGCILPGMQWEQDRIDQSAVAFGVLYGRIANAIDAHEPVYMRIEHRAHD